MRTLPHVSRQPGLAMDAAVPFDENSKMMMMMAARWPTITCMAILFGKLSFETAGSYHYRNKKKGASNVLQNSRAGCIQLLDWRESSFLSKWKWGTMIKPWATKWKLMRSKHQSAFPLKFNNASKLYSYCIHFGLLWPTTSLWLDRYKSRR